jgi:endonuclease/exonuclease/phosphatase family metal-dependent hydrolase
LLSSLAPKERAVQRLLSLATMIALGGGVWMFLSGGGLDQLAVDANAPPTQAASTSTPGAWNPGTTAPANPPAFPQATTANMPVTIGGAAPQLNDGPTIRIASFNIQVFGDKKLSDSRVAYTLAKIVQQFDVVAIQEIRTQNDRHMEDFIRLVNSAGAHYDYDVSPRLGNSKSTEQYAYVFNTDKIMIDRTSAYTLGDPNNLLHREPRVASFRTTVDADVAFTFTLVNVHTDPDEPMLSDELNVLGEVYRVVRRAGGNEDDVIMLGDFNADNVKMGKTRLGMIPDLKPLISGAGVFTNTAQTQLYDNLLIHSPSTTEYVGRSGVYNYAQPLNLTRAQAEMISDHFPVYAEFSAYERDYNGRIASRATTTAR